MQWVSDPPVWVYVLILPVASWRLAYLLVYEGGPFGVIQRLRERMGIVHADDGSAQTWPERFPATLFTCTLCMTFWTTLILYGILWVAPYIVLIIAAWGGATLLEVLRRR